MKFFKNVISELKMITWLPKSELIKMTGVVLLSTILVSAFVFGVDTIASGLYGFVMKSL